MFVEEFSKEILIPALKSCCLYSPEAAILMVGTAVIESNLQYFRQIGGGPALGFFQMEKKTYSDLLRYLNRFDNKDLKDRILASCFYSAWPSEESLIHNLRWSAVCARLKYYMSPESLPAFNDARAMALYHKKIYNTDRGATIPENSIKIFEEIIKSGIINNAIK